jgi:hypothetical protein
VYLEKLSSIVGRGVIFTPPSSLSRFGSNQTATYNFRRDFKLSWTISDSTGSQVIGRAYLPEAPQCRPKLALMKINL